MKKMKKEIKSGGIFNMGKRVMKQNLIDYLYDKRYDIKYFNFPFQELTFHDEYICKGMFKVLDRKILKIIPIYKTYWFCFTFKKIWKIAEVEFSGWSKVLYKNTLCKEHSKEYMLAKFIVDGQWNHIGG